MGSTLTNLVFHIIFSTKHREPIINQEIRNELYSYMGGIMKGEGVTLLKIGGMPDHIHLLIKLKPIHALSDMMQKIKGSSSKWVNDQDKLDQRFSWQEGYGAFTVSESQIETVARYISNQENHHRSLSFKDEFTQFLKHHGMEYDEQYLWR